MAERPQHQAPGTPQPAPTFRRAPRGGRTGAPASATPHHATHAGAGAGADRHHRPASAPRTGFARLVRPNAPARRGTAPDAGADRGHHGSAPAAPGAHAAHAARTAQMPSRPAPEHAAAGGRRPIGSLARQHLGTLPGRGSRRRPLGTAGIRGQRLGRGARTQGLASYLLGAAALVLVLALVIGIGSLIGSALFPAAPADDTVEETPATTPLVDEDGNITLAYNVAATPVSTPRSRWAQGQMPYLYQCDVAWADKPYAGDTVAQNACGPTCLTMVYIYLTGRTDYDPATMSAFADANGYAPTGATEWRFMTEGAAQLGITGQAINPTRGRITAELTAGHPVIMSVRPGDFTTVGHYIVLTDIDDRGMVTVHDPNNAMNSATRWGIATLCNQASMTWSFSA